MDFAFKQSNQWKKIDNHTYVGTQRFTLVKPNEGKLQLQIALLALYSQGGI